MSTWSHVDISLLLQRKNKKIWDFWYQIFTESVPTHKCCQGQGKVALCATEPEMKPAWSLASHTTPKPGNELAYRRKVQKRRRRSRLKLQALAGFRGEAPEKISRVFDGVWTNLWRNKPNPRSISHLCLNVSRLSTQKTTVLLRCETPRNWRKRLLRGARDACIIAKSSNRMLTGR